MSRNFWACMACVLVGETAFAFAGGHGFIAGCIAGGIGGGIAAYLDWANEK